MPAARLVGLHTHQPTHPSCPTGGQLCLAAAAVGDPAPCGGGDFVGGLLGAPPARRQEGRLGLLEQCGGVRRRRRQPVSVRAGTRWHGWCEAMGTESVFECVRLCVAPDGCLCASARSCVYGFCRGRVCVCVCTIALSVDPPALFPYGIGSTLTLPHLLVTPGPATPPHTQQVLQRRQLGTRQEAGAAAGAAADHRQRRPREPRRGGPGGARRPRRPHLAALPGGGGSQPA